MSELVEFLLARIAEDEAAAREVTVSVSAYRRWRTAADGSAREVTPERWSEPFAPARVLAECEAKRRIVEWHVSWPILVDRTVEVDLVGADAPTFAVRASQQLAWLTEQEYRKRFGDEPPTGPVLRALAAVYADHDQFREEWRV